MKTARIGFMVLGIALLMFVIVTYASAQAVTGEWFKGKVSIKGYEISGAGAIMGKAGGGATIYVNIVDSIATGSYTVTTCVPDRDAKDVWHLGTPTSISKEDSIYGDVNSNMVWDFTKSGMQFYGPAYTSPIFYVKFNGSLTKANFKTFACEFVDDTDLPSFQLGSCSISFKNLDSAKVPRGATGCIIIP
jgi:hypothetical protein